MPRKPIEVELKGLQTPRERVWSAVRKLKGGEFSLWDAQEACEPMVDFATAETYFQELEQAGYLKRVSGGAIVPKRGAQRSRPMFVLAKEQFEAPRLTDGKAVTQGLGVLAMWRGMRIAKTFSHHDIAAAASQGGMVVKLQTAKSYVLALAQAGYLTVVKPGRPAHATVYRLTRNTGPHAPAVTRRKCVFDRNTGTFAELETAQEVCDALE